VCYIKSTILCNPGHSIVLVPVGKAECCHLSRILGRQVRQKGILSHADGHSLSLSRSAQAKAPRRTRPPSRRRLIFRSRAPPESVARPLQQRLGTFVCEQERETLCCARLDAQQNLVTEPTLVATQYAVCAKKCFSLLRGEEWKCAICYAVILLFDGLESCVLCCLWNAADLAHRSMPAYGCKTRIRATTTVDSYTRELCTSKFSCLQIDSHHIFLIFFLIFH
jgi:hypothetical protein